MNHIKAGHIWSAGNSLSTLELKKWNPKKKKWNPTCVLWTSSNHASSIRPVLALHLFKYWGSTYGNSVAKNTRSATLAYTVSKDPASLT